MSVDLLTTVPVPTDDPTFVLGAAEVVLLAVSLLLTLATAAYVAWQTQHHFRLQRVTAFIERFNSGEMLRLRGIVDQTVESGVNPETLQARRAAGDDDAAERLDAMRTFANFFQELGSAHKMGTLGNRYLWAVFGGLVQRYWTDLRPLIEMMRLNRPTLYEDFENVADAMARGDAKWGSGGSKSNVSVSHDWVYIFGYGSLVSAASVARTLGHEPEPEDVREAVLRNYRRAWTVGVPVMIEGDPPDARTAVFLDLVDDAGVTRLDRAGARTIGVVVRIPAERLGEFDARERQYNRVDVSRHIEADLPPGAKVYAYVGARRHKRLSSDAAIPARYERLVTDAAMSRGEAFAEAFWASTTPSDLPRFEGEYRFANARQNAASGRGQPSK